MLSVFSVLRYKIKTMDEGIKKDVIINVQTNYDEALANLVAYKKEVAALSAEKKKYKEMLDTGMISEEEYAAAIAKTTAEQKNASASAGSWEKVVRNSLKIDKEKTGSLTQMRAQLSNLTNEYNNLSKAERQSAKGTELKDKIKGVSDGLKENEAGIGLFQRNVGNYKSAVEGLSGGLSGLIGPLGGVAKGIDVVGVSTKVAMGPIGLLLAAIGFLVSVFKTFDPVIDVIEQKLAALFAIFDTLKDGVISLITGQKTLTQVITGMGGAMSKAAEDAVTLKKAQQELDDMTWKNIASSAKYQRQINELLLQSKDRTKSDKERAALIEQALKIEEKAYQERKAIADRELEIAQGKIIVGKNLTKEEIKNLKERGVEYAIQLKETKSVTDDEVKALADAEANKENILNESIAIREKAINRQNVLIEKAQEAEVKAAEALKKRKADEAKILEDAEKLAVEILEDGVNKQIALINLTYDAQIKAIQTRLTSEKDLTVAARKSLNETLVLLDQRRYQEIDKLSDESINAAVNAELERVTKVLEASKDNAKKAAEVFALEWENRLLQVKEGTEAETALKQAAAEADYKRLLTLDDATKRDLYESDAAYTKALLLSKRKLNEATEDANNAEREAMTIKLEAARAIGEGFQNILEAVGESSNSLALAAKAIALFNIGLATAEAIAKGIAASQSVPFPGNLAAIATTIGTVLTNVASAYKIVSSLGDDPSSTTQGSASGGSVSSKVVSTTVPYQAATTGLYSATVTDKATNSINNVNLSDQAAKAIKDAVSSLPAPVVSVEEITKGQRKVNVVEGTRRLG